MSHEQEEIHHAQESKLNWQIYSQDPVQSVELSKWGPTKHPPHAHLLTFAYLYTYSLTTYLLTYLHLAKGTNRVAIRCVPGE